MNWYDFHGGTANERHTQKAKVERAFLQHPALRTLRSENSTSGFNARYSRINLGTMCIPAVETNLSRTTPSFPFAASRALCTACSKCPSPPVASL
jgi:hypothetical protein